VIKVSFLFLFQWIFAAFVTAQSVDTLPKQPDSSHNQPDTALINNITTKDSLWKRALNDSAWRSVANQFPGGNFIIQAYQKNRFFGFQGKPVFIRSNKKEFKGKEALFYALIILALFFAFIKLAFPRYLADLFRVAFRTTLKQRQIGEQLVQTPLPSLLLNIFFLLTGGLYIDFLLQHYHLVPADDFWLFYFYSFLFLAVIYLIKFFGLKLSGTIFNISDTTNAYIFIVFMINKIIGICLLPCLVLLAFSDHDLYLIAFTLAYAGVFALVAYRFFLAYGLVRNQIRLNPFHFFLYLCAFEIVPLLLIYKLLLIWL
jgi:hypothetical protein